jgi:endonuclease-3
MPANPAPILQLLVKEYGIREWYARRDPVSELVFTILTQNTSDANAFRAFDKLTSSFNNWVEIANANEADIAKLIKFGGLSNVKAPRIKTILQQIPIKGGVKSLSFLEDLSLEQAKIWLTSLDGVGPKTAACVLLFSFGKPALPVDTHVFRVAKRLHLIEEKVSVDRAHTLLEELIRPEDVYNFHVSMIEHGRRICHARKPDCNSCSLRNRCPSKRSIETLD